ncbi:hypothetical protein Sango_1070800 [Sesamum angolense]|uniref:Retrotransposon Copia-like N-terminal domain-containing protein n=1 Tax=Sesamum angolense TaxID=2727404 RepID=A0AAE2BVR7_9LAMI|nr:hypothetical protein Sango_1070800 [Sesamum angolense]
MRIATEPTAARKQSTENSSLVMISTPFNGTNWLTWSISVRLALEGNDKLGFIDGSYVKPHEGSADMKQWRITDSRANLDPEYYDEGYSQCFFYMFHLLEHFG